MFRTCSCCRLEQLVSHNFVDHFLRIHDHGGNHLNDDQQSQ